MDSDINKIFIKVEAPSDVFLPEDCNYNPQDNLQIEDSSRSPSILKTEQEDCHLTTEEPILFNEGNNFSLESLEIRKGNMCSRESLIISDYDETIKIEPDSSIPEKVSIQNYAENSAEEKKLSSQGSSDPSVSCGMTSSTSHTQKLCKDTCVLETMSSKLDHSIKANGAMYKFLKGGNLLDTGINTCTCGGCKNISTNLSYMKLHIAKKPYTCIICDKTFTQSTSLKRHLKVHTCEKSYSCHICKKKFKCPQLSRHMQVHTGEKPYSCDICGEAFAQLCTLSQHMKIHTGEKPYSCMVCKKTFRQSSTLSQHMKVHTNDKPYSCRICEKSFRKSFTLNQHIKVHTGEKPYSCHICQKTFTQSSNLKRHISLHTDEKSIKCDICSKVFSRASYLRRHKNLHTWKTM